MASLATRLRAHTGIPLYRNAYALMLSGGVSSALGFVFWIVASRLYPPEVVGTASSAIAALMFLTGVASLYLDGSLIRFVPRAGRATPRLVLTCYALSSVVAALVAVVFILGLDVWAPKLAVLGSTWYWVLGCVLATVASCVFTLEDGVLTGLRQAKWVPLENIAYALAKLALIVVLADGAAEHGILIAWVLPLVVVVPAVNLLLLRLVRRHAARTAADAEEVTARRVGRYAFGNYLGYLCSLASSRLPPLLVLNVAGGAASAFFYLPWMITGTLTLLTINLSTSLIVEGAVDPANVALHVRRAFKQVLRLLVPTVAVLIAVAPLLLHVYGERYAAEGAAVLRLLSLAALPGAVCVLAFGVARLHDRVTSIVVTQFALAVAILGLSAVLLPRMGIEGVGVALLASQTVAAAALAWMHLVPVLRR